MAVQSQKNTMDVLIGKDIAGTAIATLVTNAATQDITTYLPDGQVILVGLNSTTGIEEPVPTTITTTTPAGAALYPSVRFAVNNGGQVNYSERIFLRDVIAADGTDGTAATQQVTILGYNGTAGSIDATATNYILTFVGDWDWAMWEEQKYRYAFNYYSLNPTQQSIATSFSTQFNRQQFYQVLNGTGQSAKCEVLNSGAAADWTSAGTVAVVNGSDIVTLSATSVDAQVVGAILRLGATGSGVGVTIPVYIVTAIPSTDSTLSSTQVRIHTYFQGTTAAALDATSGDAGLVTAGTNWGLKFTGLPLTWGIPPYSDFKYQVVSFHFDMVGFGTTTVSNPTLPNRGQGTYQEVAEYENFAMGNQGALNRTVIPLPLGRHATVVDGTITAYDTLQVEHLDKRSNSAIQAPAFMRQQVYVFIPDAAANMTKLLTQVNPLFLSAGIISTSITV